MGKNNSKVMAMKENNLIIIKIYTRNQAIKADVYNYRVVLSLSYQ